VLHTSISEEIIKCLFLEALGTFHSSSSRSNDMWYYRVKLVSTNLHSFASALNLNNNQLLVALKCLGLVRKRGSNMNVSRDGNAWAAALAISPESKGEVLKYSQSLLSEDALPNQLFILSTTKVGNGDPMLPSQQKRKDSPPKIK